MKKKETKGPSPKPETDKSYSGRQKRVPKKKDTTGTEGKDFEKKHATGKVKEFSDVGFRQNNRKTKPVNAEKSGGLKKKRRPDQKPTTEDRRPKVKIEPPTYTFPEKKKPRGKEAQPQNDEIRLNRYIANAGICSRREADELIASGLIQVNNKVVTEMGFKVKGGDSVKYNNKILKREKLVYVLLNKPRDFITTTDDPEERRTVMDLVKTACEERIYPVGRLDRNTTGLLLLTNDGELADLLSHPSNNISKIYQVEIDKPIVKEDFDQIVEGVVLDDGPAPVDDLAIVSPDRKILGVEIHLGRNRIVRRIFEKLGYDVLRLDRVGYAGLTKKDLPRGNWRYLTEKEVIKLKHFS